MTTINIQKNLQDSKIPNWMIWVQCIAFVVLYAVWILPEIVGFRNTALVVGAVFGAYSIFQYRRTFFQKSAIPIWLIVALFAWATFHLFFIGTKFPLQYIEYLRIWKYTAFGAVMACQQYWGLIYFALCMPVISYLVKFVLTWVAHNYGVNVPTSLQVYETSRPFYVSKTDYVSFCLPIFSIALGSLVKLADIKGAWRVHNLVSLFVQVLVIAAPLFLFVAQNIKNGMAYAAMLFVIFGAALFFGQVSKLTWKKFLALLVIFIVLSSAIGLNVKRNESWSTLIADIKVGVQLQKYPNWRDTIKYGHPINEYGTIVSATNYERAAWAYAVVKLAAEYPLGYGLIEDSFAKIAKEHWPDLGNNLSHSHSGWLDVVLALGFPGFFLIIGALFLTHNNSRLLNGEWRIITFWPLLANFLLWCTTEVSAAVTFAALIFWICLGGALVAGGNTKTPFENSHQL